MNTRELIEECRAALAEELSSWDIDPPLHHVKQAHDKCVAWLAAAPPPPAQPTRTLLEQTDALIVAAERYAVAYDGDDRNHIKTDVTNAFYAGWKYAQAAQPEPEPVAWVDERAISWLADHSRRLDASITTKLEARKSFERPMALYAAPPPPAPEQPTEDGSTEKTGTVPWPVVESYSGGADPAGIGGRVWLRMGDGPETVEYVPAQPALSDERVREIVKECGLDWHRGYAPLFDGDDTNRYAVLVRYVERALRGQP